jgi:AcrR family transcriptional regulator
MSWARGASQVAKARGRGGRSLDSSRDLALREAALALLAEVGYDRLTMDAVAARARAGKTTIYRRWPGKAELVVDAGGRPARRSRCCRRGSWPTATAAAPT